MNIGGALAAPYSQPNPTPSPCCALCGPFSCLSRHIPRYCTLQPS